MEHCETFNRKFGSLLISVLLASSALTSGCKDKDAPPPDGGPFTPVRFEFDGSQTIRIQDPNAAVTPTGRSARGETSFAKPSAEELLVVFRDSVSNTDSGYRIRTGGGEFVCVINNVRMPDSIRDRQVFIDVTAGTVTSVEIRKRDARQEIRDAVASGDRAMVSKLLNSDQALANTQYPESQWLLMTTGDEEVAGLLIAAKADPNATDKHGFTALHHAAWNNRLGIVKLLLANKWDINAQSADGDTPLHLAVERRHKEVARYLLDRGADGNLKNKRGATPLHNALEHLPQ